MARQVSIRDGLGSLIAVSKGVLGELFYNRSTGAIHTQDGVTLGGAQLVASWDSQSKIRAFTGMAAANLIRVDGRATPGDGGGGQYRWASGDMSTEVASDEVTSGEGDGGEYLAPSWDKTGASGCWVREIAPGEALVPEIWGAKGDCVVADSAGTITVGTDDTAALKAWHRATVERGRIAALGEKIYYVTATIGTALPAAGGRASGRAGHAHIRGAGMYASVIYAPTLAGYVFDYSGAAGRDALTFEKFSIKTLGTGGGGIKTGEGGNQTFRDFFMDGCGDGYWGLFLDDGSGNGPYQVVLDNVRMWNDVEEYRGGAFYMADGHTLLIQSAFISKQEKDGDVCYIKNVKNITILTLTLESNPQGSTEMTSQVMLVLDANCISTWIANIHYEGVANTLIELRANASNRHLSIGKLYAWSKDTNGAGLANFQIIKAPSLSVYDTEIQDVFYKSDLSDASSPSDLVLIDDPLDKITVERYTFAANAPQTNRPLKLNPDPISKREAVFAGSSTLAPSASVSLAAQGVYLLSATVIASDDNHAISGVFVVTFDDATNDFTSAVQVGSSITKGSGLSDLAASVTNAGALTVSATSATSRNFELRYGYQKLADL